MGAPFFSVLMPSYNQADYLPIALDSVLAQSFTDWEAIVVDDGSTDRTPEVLAAYAARDPRIRWVRKTNGGTAAALNEAYRNATGTWICWLSTDDWFESNKLAVHRAAIDQLPEARFFHTNFFLYDDAKQEKSLFNSSSRSQYMNDRVLSMFMTNYINGISICLHKDVFERIGLFDEKHLYTQDYDFFMKSLLLYKAEFIDEPTVTYRIHEASTSNASYNGAYYEMMLTGLRILNTSSFEELFPDRNFSHANDIAWVVNVTVSLACSNSICLDFANGTNALIDRLREWLTAGRGRVVADAVRGEIRRRLEQRNLPKITHDRLSLLAEPLGVYRPYEGYGMAVQQFATSMGDGKLEDATCIASFLLSHGVFGPSMADVLNRRRAMHGLPAADFSRFIRLGRRSADAATV